MQDTLTHRQLKSLVHVSTVINSSLDIETIFDLIIGEAISAVDAAGGGSIWVFDQQKQRLMAKSAHGLFYPQIFKSIELSSGESMTGMTFQMEKGLVFKNEEEIKQALDTLTPDNRTLLDESIPDNFHFTSIISSPILSKGTCIGVITLDSFDKSLHFKKEDMQLLEAIAEQAAIALEKSNIYYKEKKIVQQLSRSIETQRNIANLVVNGEGIQSIIDYIYKTIGEHIFLFDEIGELTASACRTPVSEEMQSEVRRFAKQNDQSPNRPYSVSEITLGLETYQFIALSLQSKMKSLGTLIIVSKDPIGEAGIIALEHICTVIMLELVKVQAVYETQQRLQGEFMTKILSGQAIDETLMKQAKNLQFDLNRNYIAVSINVENKDKLQHGAISENVINNLLHMTNKYFLGKNSQGAALIDQNKLVALFSYPAKLQTANQVSSIKQLALHLQQEIEKTYSELDITIGIGRMKSNLAAAHESFKEAEKCITFMKSYHFEERALSYTDLGIQRFILQNSEEELLDFVHEVIGSLIQYEQTRKGDLLQTLLTYLRQNQNIKRTAVALHVHTNTLNYRLKRIEEILSTDLTDGQQLFNIQLAGNIYHYIKR
ncbi:helix-turn-helix domain-containing protein [Sporosarcina sp. P29]|uniref:helix-turn-helix domain-containing protein n=1 Tax=Sporosarcina sp. P29 TaxID=2048252 RepID=UPI000C168CDF|nr:helix-turn-helix domain-containing protein [Sporosarcina sp. P29]PID00680.1 hypothetical protein CSV68_00185 [Sporosarcina sp. P29]